MSLLDFVQQSLPPRILVVDDDEDAAAGIAEALAATGRDVTTCSDAICASVLLDHHHFDSVISDLHLRGSFTFDGLSVAARAKAVNPAVRVVMMTGYASDDALRAARSHGAQVLAKPFEMEELERFIPAQRDRVGRIDRMPPLEETLAEHLATPRFQPIVRFTRDGVALEAVEALTRVDARLPLGTPDALFRYAVARDAVPQADLSCLGVIFDHAQLLDVPALFINVHPRSLGDASFPDRLLGIVSAANWDPANLVVEITEYESLPQSATALRTLMTLRNTGIRFALDDLGMAHSHLVAVDSIRPSFMKITFDIGASNRPETRWTLMHNLTAMAHELRCEVIAERIETQEDEQIARDLGIDLGQGYRFGHPAFAVDVGMPYTRTFAEAASPVR